LFMTDGIVLQKGYLTLLKLRTMTRSYINYARELAKIPRKSGVGSQFTHQIAVWGLLLEFGYSDKILLEASLIHDLFEDGPKVGFTDFEKVKAIGKGGAAVFDLVSEVSIRCDSTGRKEAKEEFLLRIMLNGSVRAKILKLADRLQNLTDLSFPNIDRHFARRYLKETESFIIPYSQSVDPLMAEALRNLVSLNCRLLNRTT
jgi:(p)ppGpp synthase/HD superfamily hydrolase